VIVVDDRKLVSHLGSRYPVPVEVAPFGWQVTARELLDLGAKPVLRRNPDDEPFIGDGGHKILDCAFGQIASAESLARKLDHVVGLVEHGLFIGMTPEVRVAGASGVRVLKEPTPDVNRSAAYLATMPANRLSERVQYEAPDYGRVRTMAALEPGIAHASGEAAPECRTPDSIPADSSSAIWIYAGAAEAPAAPTGPCAIPSFRIR